MMNSLDWEDSVRRWQININSNQKNDEDYRMQNTTPRGSHAYCQYRGDTVNDPQNRLQAVQGGPGGPCPSTSNWETAELCDPDGTPWEADQEDHELTRKLRELREIEEKIMCRKVSIACKTVLKPSLAARDKQSDKCTGPTLKDRVNAILQQRQSNNSLSKSHFHRNRIKSSGPNKDDQQQEEHPLKIRVNVLMKHRMGLPVSPSNTQPPPIAPQSIVSPPAKESSIDQGFQRFLNVLNKGVDVDLLRRIVNDDSEDLCLDAKLQDVQHREATDSPFRNKTRYSNDVISLPDHGGSGERSTDPRSTDPRSQERSRSIPTPDRDESKEEALSPFSSKTLSNSPAGIKNTKGGDENIMHDEQHVQLQNILKSLGLQLEVEEMSKLANRTQERLYGKKAESTRAEGGQKPDGRPRSSPRRNRSSSSSSSTSSSSRSSSRRSSSGSSCRRNSGSGRRLAADGNRSSGRGSETPTRQEDDRRLGVGNEAGTQFTDQPSYPQNQTFAPPDPSYSFPPFPDYSQYSHYDAYGTDSYDAVGSYWTYSQVPAFPPGPPGSYPCPQDEGSHFPITVVEGTRDLGRPPNRQGPQAAPQRTAARKEPKKSNRAKNLRRRMMQKRKRWKELSGLAAAKTQAAKEEPAREQRRADRAEKSPSNGPVDRDAKAESSEESKRSLTEEEIKANLRKTLEAFNRKVKEAAARPISSLSSQTDEDLLMKL